MQVSDYIDLEKAEKNGYIEEADAIRYYDAYRKTAEYYQRIRRGQTTILDFPSSILGIPVLTARKKCQSVFFTSFAVSCKEPFGFYGHWKEQIGEIK